MPLCVAIRADGFPPVAREKVGSGAAGRNRAGADDPEPSNYRKRLSLNRIAVLTRPLARGNLASEPGSIGCVWTAGHPRLPDRVTKTPAPPL